MTTVGVNGAGGRMGRAVLEAAADRDDVAVAFGVHTTAVDTEVPVYDPDAAAEAVADHDPDVVVDFAVPDATAAMAEVCAGADVGLVVGTTGLEEGQLTVVQEASGAVPVLKATNFSRGIQALLRALEPALESLSGYDLELLETHHNRKRDAPSGTAKTILETVADHRSFETVYGREGVQPREPGEGEVGVLVRRAGTIHGEHEVTLADNDEVLTLSHRAEDRGVFAAGALDAAVWLAGRNPGWYTFGDVIDEP